MSENNDVSNKPLERLAHARSERRTSQPPRLMATPMRWIVAGALTFVIIVFFSVVSDDWITIVNYTMIAAIAALGLNVLSGYTGQVSLGIAFFMSIGAYTAALLGGNQPTSSFDPNGLALPWLIWLPAAGIIAALVGALIGPSALRLKGFYLGIVSLSLIFIGQYIFKSAAGISGGPQGRTFPIPTFGDSAINQQNDLFGIALTAAQQYFLFLLPILVIAALFVGNVMRSRAGRAMRAVRDNEIGASIMGVNLFQTKMGAFILSSFLAGIAGALYSSYNSYVTPDYWSLTLSIQFVAAIIVGGVASVWGSILGAAFVFGLPLVIDQFKLLPLATSSGGMTSGDLNAIIYGLLIIAFLLFEPGGIMSLAHRIQVWYNKLYRSQKKGGETGEITDLNDLMDLSQDTHFAQEDAALPIVDNE
ncbi:MAG TPA: branched-chain amino acid ABC transporter permease [Ktedonobacteraceae bacterium]|nr:branched-chain amino acid ABC transporter permease [Ktedonobacteraceae bacterium]